MPDNLVEVKVVADATQAKAEIVDLGRKVSETLSKLGMDPKVMGPRLDPSSQKALEAYFDSLKTKTAQANAEIKQTGNSMEEAGRKGSSAFEKLEGMISRMMVRLVAFKLIFDAIKAIGDTIGENVKWQSFSAQYKSFSSDADRATAHLKDFETAAAQTGADAENIAAMALELEKVGENAELASKDAQTLAKYAEVSGQNAEKVLAAFEHVSKGVGTMDEARLLAGLDLTRQINALEAYKAGLKGIGEMEDRIYTLQERARGESQRQADAVEGFSGKMGIVENVWQRIVNHQSTASTQLHIFKDGYETASVNLDAAGQAMGRMMTIGQQRVMQEEGLNSYQMQQLEKAGLIDSSYVLQAYHRQVAANERKEEWSHEDLAYNRKLQLQKNELSLNQQVAQELRAGVALQKEWEKHAATADASIKSMEQSFKNIARDLPGIAEAMGKLAAEAQKVANALDNVFKGVQKPEWDWPLKAGNPQYAPKPPEWDWPLKQLRNNPTAMQGAELAKQGDYSLLGILEKIYEHQVHVFGH